jgi:toxin-antitoxin system PIN domain toxin
MILIDANVLLYAHDTASSHQATARAWLEGVVSDEPDVRFALASLLAFIRIATDPRVFHQPMPAAEAIAIVGDLLTRPNVSIATPGDRHWAQLAELAAAGRARGPLLMDAHLAALAIEHGATLATSDRDFKRFAGLRTSDPIGTGLRHPA